MTEKRAIRPGSSAEKSALWPLKVISASASTTYVRPSDSVTVRLFLLTVAICPAGGDLRRRRGRRCGLSIRRWGWSGACRPDQDRLARGIPLDVRSQRLTDEPQGNHRTSAHCKGGHIEEARSAVDRGLA